MTTVTHSLDYYDTFMNIRNQFMDLGLILRYSESYKHDTKIILKIQDALSEYAFELQS